MERMGNYGAGLHRVVYASRMADLDPARLDAEVEAIVAVSRRNNATQGVTGLLLAHEGFFVQALEGSHAVISRLLERIALDSRHGEMRIVGVEPLGQRGFGRWSMRAGLRPFSRSGAAFDPFGMGLANLTALLTFSAALDAGLRRRAA